MLGTVKTTKDTHVTVQAAFTTHCTEEEHSMGKLGCSVRMLEKLIIVFQFVWSDMREFKEAGPCSMSNPLESEVIYIGYLTESYPEAGTDWG